jgi:ABC-type lipoprotein release transport system permease subunit
LRRSLSPALPDSEAACPCPTAKPPLTSEGLGAGLYGSKSIETFLFDVSTRDVTTFVTVPCLLAAVALLACYLPARRAMRVDPMVALRDS